MNTITLLAVAAAVVAASPAAAEPMTSHFTLTGPAGGYSARWELPAAPTPTSWVLGQGFALERVSGTFPRSTANDAYLDFFSLANRGGLSISDADGPNLLATLAGVQLYTGTEAAPVFRRGTFALTNVAGSVRYTLTIADLGGSVPEPQTWALMILGFGAVGCTMRVRTRRATVRCI